PASAHRAAVEHFDLPSVLIDGDFNILRVYGDTEPYLRLPAGEPTHRLLDMVQPELVYGLTRALKNALAKRRSVTVTGLRDRDRNDYSLSLRLTPMESGEDAGASRLLVSFMRAHDLDEREAARFESVTASDLEGSDPREWSEAVRISHEELEASREELQAL